MTQPLNDPPLVNGKDHGEVLNGVAVPAISAAIPSTADDISPERRLLLDKVAQDRRELLEVAGRLRGPVRTLEAAQSAVVLARRTIRWATLAGNVVTLAMWLKSGRGRPPIAVVLGVSYELFNVWSHLSAAEKPERRVSSP